MFNPHSELLQLPQSYIFLLSLSSHFQLQLFYSCEYDCFGRFSVSAKGQQPFKEAEYHQPNTNPPPHFYHFISTTSSFSICESRRNMGGTQK